MSDVNGAAGLPAADAVLFDFNGTLSDDEEHVCRIMQNISAKHLGGSLTREQYFTELVGLDDLEILGRLAARFGAAGSVDIDTLLQDSRRQYREAALSGRFVDAATVDMVERLAAAGMPIGVVTGASRADVIDVLGVAGILDRFRTVIALEDVQEGKPAPEGYLKGAEHLQIANRARTMVFEDSAAGLRSARSAGMIPVLVNRNGAGSAVRALADHIVDSLDGAVADALLAGR